MPRSNRLRRDPTARRPAWSRKAEQQILFEYWLLLHHEDCGTGFARCDEVNKRLQRVVKAYDKARLRFADFGEGIDAAVKRARQRDPSGREHGVNPSSGVWRLVERMVG